MNRQPYCKPPRWWPPKMSPRWVHLTKGYRYRQLLRGQQLTEIDVTNLGVLRDQVARGHGVLITPNHSAHYDSVSLYTVADRIGQPLYFMTAWQVFAMSGRFERAAMQRLGCFSVDREHNDRRAFKQAVRILRDEPHPLVIFPEGDIYHMSDCVTPFREGAAAVSLAADKRGNRRQVILPCAIKFWYVDDPTERLNELMRVLESRLYLRTQDAFPLRQRIHRLAEAALALKELDYLGHTRAGRVRDRVAYLIEAVLRQLEQRHGLHPPAGASPPQRVKQLRQCVISKLDSEEKSTAPAASESVAALQSDMEDLFLTMQMFSYRGDYLADQPSIERLAETVDKFEEDVLGRDYPTLRGRRRVTVRFGEPIPVAAGQRGRDRIMDLTRCTQNAVQQLIDQGNRNPPSS